MSEKKVVSRYVAVGIGVLCILLLAAVAGVFFIYTLALNNKNSEIADLQATNQNLIEADDSTINMLSANISSLNLQIVDQNNTISSLNTQISHLNSNVTSLQTQVVSDNSTINRLDAIVNLSSSTVWVDHELVNQTARSYASWSFSVTYAGYVVVGIQSSSINNTSVELKYSWNGVNYNSTVSVGSGGQASFPVLPANNIGVRVINNSSTSASEIVTITYWY